MSVIDKLSSSLDRRDEEPNELLAREIAASDDDAVVKELIRHLSGKNKKIQNDCIKVLYEVGVLKPRLISSYIPEFKALLSSKNNRLQWGGMTALNAIVVDRPDEIYAILPEIIEGAEKGSVITKDNAMGILIHLSGIPEYEENAFSLFAEQLIQSPTNQLPMYAERAVPVISDRNRELFVQTLTSRLNDIDKESKRKRVEKVIRKVGSLKS